MSADRFFRLKGRVLTHDGKGVRVFLTIVDVNPLVDDVIAHGTSNTDGTFQLSFAREAFNQGIFDHAAKPEALLIKVGARDADGRLHDLMSQRVVAPFFDDSLEDVGDIVLAEAAAPPLELGLMDDMHVDTRHHRRLTVDDEAVAYALAEVGPVVEELTGWRDLAAGVRIRIGSTLAVSSASWNRASSKLHEHTWLDDLRGRFANRMSLALAAFYDPFDNVITLDEALLSETGLDAAKVALGHELVRAGQFREVPSLLGRYDEALATNEALFGVPPEAPISDVQRAALLRSAALLVATEGHAAAVEERGLLTRFPFGRISRNFSPGDFLYMFTFGTGALIQAKVTGKEIPTGAPLDGSQSVDQWLRVIAIPALRVMQHVFGKTFFDLRTEAGAMPRFDASTLGEVEEALPELVKGLHDHVVAEEKAAAAARAAPAK